MRENCPSYVSKAACESLLNMAPVCVLAPQQDPIPSYTGKGTPNLSFESLIKFSVAVCYRKIFLQRLATEIVCESSS